MPKLRDLLYLDFDKAASLFSQAFGGLLREMQEGRETEEDQRNIRKYDLKVFKPEFGGQKAERTSQLETRVLHHDLLGRVEEYLRTERLVVDLNATSAGAEPDIEAIRSSIGDTPYLLVEGWATIEDYQRFGTISSRFNELSAFIGRCSASSLEQTEVYQALEKQIDDARRRAEGEKDRNKRARAETQVAKAEQQLRDEVARLSGLGGVPEWLLDGVQMFVDIFMPGRILLRLFPFESTPEFQVLANLKRNCFVDGDLDTVVHAYGNRPNVPLSVLGLVTSLPPVGGRSFDPMNEFAANPIVEDEDPRGLGKVFRGVFASFENFYRYTRYSRYPNVTVFPLAVYRSIS